MFDELKALIAQHANEVVEFGDPSSDLGPTEERINETQELLGCRLPSSYLWFVQTYGGGEIYGEEIYSIYPILSETAVGDICYQTRWFREKGLVTSSDIVISSNDFGEVFCLDTSISENGEYPVFVRAGQTSKAYAQNFADFLRKRIEEPAG